MDNKEAWPFDRKGEIALFPVKETVTKVRDGSIPQVDAVSRLTQVKRPELPKKKSSNNPAAALVFHALRPSPPLAGFFAPAATLLGSKCLFGTAQELERCRLKSTFQCNTVHRARPFAASASGY